MLIPISSEDDIISANPEVTEALIEEKENLDILSSSDLDEQIAKLKEEDDFPF